MSWTSATPVTPRSKANVVEGKRIKNMKFVKPRFNSAQAPLARSILFFDALFGLAVELSAVRSGDDPARVSQLFLATVNEEKLVQAGMMADAGDESLQVTRQLGISPTNFTEA